MLRWLLLVPMVVLVVLFAPQKLAGLGRGIRSGLDNFKKGLKGEEDIDITHTVKRIEEDTEK